MTSSQSFHLKIYRTQTFIKSLLGLILLGTMGLLGLQRIMVLPAWVQYLVLTAVLLSAFIAASNLCAKPVWVRLGSTGISVNQERMRERQLPWEEIRSYASYQELLLYSLKIHLRAGESLALIRFKWEQGSDFHAFLTAFENWLGTSDLEGTISRAATFYRSRTQIILTFVLLVAYTLTAFVLVSGNAFTAWNPVWTYYFWVVPAAFFIKMWKAR